MKAGLLFFFLLFGGFLALAESKCGSSAFLQRFLGAGGRIVGGQRVTHCSHIPWQVRLDIGGYLCGGSILGPRHILTAAHCTRGRSASSMKVYSGNVEYTSRARMTRVLAKHEHHNYNPQTKDSDVAILELATSLSFDDCTAPICRKAEPEFRDGQLCVVSGWGTTSWKGEVSQFLRMVGVRVTPGSSCRGYNFQNRNNVVCAADLNKDACQGDSGGPLVCQQSDGTFAQVGIVSYGNECAKPGYPGVYAHAGTFHYWINEIMGS